MLTRLVHIRHVGGASSKAHAAVLTRPDASLPPGRLPWYYGAMVERETPTPKRRAPAPTGDGKSVQVRIHEQQMAELDIWRAAQDDDPSRPEAIRRLIAIGLKGGGSGFLR